MESVRMQAAEATNPTSYISKKKDHFKPAMSSKKEKKIKKRKVTFVTEEQKEKQLLKGKEILMSQSDAKRRSKAKKVPTEIITEEEIQRKIDDSFKLIEIEKRKLIEDEKKKKQKLVNPNPPVVIFTDGLGISVCNSCTKKKIECEEITYPHNMVF